MQDIDADFDRARRIELREIDFTPPASSKYASRHAQRRAKERLGIGLSRREARIAIARIRKRDFVRRIRDYVHDDCAWYLVDVASTKAWLCVSERRWKIITVLPQSVLPNAAYWRTK
jgi:hypothetical protein